MPKHFLLRYCDYFLKCMLCSRNNIILDFFCEINKVGTVSAYPHYKVPVLLRMRLCF